MREGIKDMQSMRAKRTQALSTFVAMLVLLVAHLAGAHLSPCGAAHAQVSGYPPGQEPDPNDPLERCKTLPFPHNKLCEIEFAVGDGHACSKFWTPNLQDCCPQNLGILRECRFTASIPTPMLVDAVCVKKNTNWVIKGAEKIQCLCLLAGTVSGEDKEPCNGECGSYNTYLEVEGRWGVIKYKSEEACQKGIEKNRPELCSRADHTCQDLAKYLSGENGLDVKACCLHRKTAGE
jgi:hypothetical protein